ncbi:Mitochondrial amidoxime reducing component 2 [Portunus trituberculatus]|uniref:Mitochondrial amidoxime reducing component 2 n=1 Tax=Portunus trituberculatus TaxID=210409 RepID=A0A5B7D8B6_PORTR|nr:Mitochondrial amidoxime reducing component 2 [Portunus trituberculatus]
MNTPKVFNADVRGFDCGDEAAAWLTNAVNDGVVEGGTRLLYHGNLTRDRKAREPAYYSFSQYKASDKVLYADTCAFMLTSETSLADLNSRLERPITLDWFRSNIVVRGVKEPYDEDDYAFVRIGDVVFRRLKPCDRCVFTNVDPEVGKKCEDGEPINTLKKYRHVDGPEKLQRTWAQKPVFGVHLGIDACGKVCVGDKVEVARASCNPRWKYL